MKDWKSLSHVKWDCKYHLVFVSNYRHRKIYGEIRKKIGGIIRDLCKRKEIELHEGHAKLNHIHLLLSIPPKYSVSNTAGFIKGKSAIRIHREVLNTNFKYQEDDWIKLLVDRILRKHSWIRRRHNKKIYPRAR